MMDVSCIAGIGIGALVSCVLLWGRDRYISGYEAPDETRRRRQWWGIVALAAVGMSVAWIVAFPGR